VGNLAQLWVGAYLVLGNEITLGQLIAFRIISGNVTGSLLRFVSVWQSFQEVSMSIDMLKDVVDTPTETSDEDRSNIPLPAIQGQVTYEEVSFRFLESGPLQLANVNLEFPAGSFVGIVGGSGSGKSTAMKLLQRLYPPLSGRIFIDGYDIGKVELYSLRSQLGVVLQDTLLFNCSVQENIALSNPDASTDEIVRAAKLAVAHDFIMSLPAGYNTIVGERGASLSGGQRQRLAIARTILQNPKLLILDEATSALDYHSERQVCNNLAEAFAGRTVFFITHRLTTIQNADIIIMMDQGSVVERGTHKELMALKGRYYCLFQQQESSNT
jgi:ATP-binding cassette subfamily B protein